MIYFELFKINNFICLLAWEPSAAQVINMYSHSLPALEQFYQETKFSLIKSDNISKPS